MKLISQLLVALAVSISGLTVSAQTTGTSAPLTGNWNNVVTGTHPGANECCWGGPQPLYDPATNTIHFSYTLTAVHRVIAINQALSGSGVQINGYNWGYDLRNMNGVRGLQSGTDSIVATTFMTNRFNQFLVQDDRHYNTQFDWTRFSGTVGLPTSVSLSDAGSLGIQFVAKDSGHWGGYYGPQVRDVEMTVNYTSAPVDPCVANPQSSPTCAGYKTYYNNMTDDSYQQVNLPFVFPFYGQNFTTSYMFTNGVVGFLNPNNNNFCCSGVNLNSNPGPTWNYAIYGLQADLGPGADSRFWSQVGDGGTSMKYGWDRVYDLGTNNASTFNIQIKDSGYIGINYQSINSQANVTAGVAGDISKGEYSQIYHGWAGAFTPNTQYTFTGTEVVDQCPANPLSSPNCPGYQQAYFNQQCSSNALYNSQCSGYQQAYFNQQCSQNTLYDTQCPGYATAYYNSQCTASALYHTGCPGYATAYFDQQCSLNSLYNSQCPGYATAYFDQQCSLNTLYNSQCPGYADAYYVQQCTVSPLYDSGCTGYAQAYFDQQCSLDPLYNSQCTGYREAYALKYIVIEKPKATETVAVAAAATPPPVAEPPPPAAPAPVATASPADSATAPVQLVPPPAPVAAAAPAESKKETKTADATGSTSSSTASGGGSKEQPKTTRQALAERRMEAAREKAATAAKQNPAAMAAQMDTAGSMEQQVELQSVVLGAMGFVAGFDTYSRSTIPDAVGYKPFDIYPGQRNIDSPAARLLLVRSDRIHQDMVDSQYKK
jgi:hypothetical protein